MSEKARAMDRAREELRAGLGALGIDPGAVLYLHVRLRGLARDTGLDYPELCELLLGAVDGLEPRAVLVPAFTYSFTRTGVFHALFSRSETGRFSEEVRTRFMRHRTPDPIFSVMDTRDWLAGQKVDSDTAFGPGCLFEVLEAEGAQVLNVDIRPMVATHVHYCERVAEVPYRRDIVFPGVVYETETRLRRVDYVYRARDLDSEWDLDWDKIAGHCREAGILRSARVCGVELLAFGCREFASMVARGLADDERFLLSRREAQGEK